MNAQSLNNEKNIKMISTVNNAFLVLLKILEQRKVIVSSLGKVYKKQEIIKKYILLHRLTKDNPFVIDDVESFLKKNSKSFTCYKLGTNNLIPVINMFIRNNSESVGNIAPILDFSNNNPSVRCFYLKECNATYLISHNCTLLTHQMAMLRIEILAFIIFNRKRIIKEIGTTTVISIEETMFHLNNDFQCPLLSINNYFGNTHLEVNVGLKNFRNNFKHFVGKPINNPICEERIVLANGYACDALILDDSKNDGVDYDFTPNYVVPYFGVSVSNNGLRYLDIDQRHRLIFIKPDKET